MNFNGIKCPNCEKKGLHFASHPHAYGWKDYDKVECRFCKKEIQERRYRRFARGQGGGEMKYLFIVFTVITVSISTIKGIYNGVDRGEFALAALIFLCTTCILFAIDRKK